VAKNIHSMIAEGVAPGDIAVLVRGRSFAIPLKAQLDLLGVPNRLVGGNESFFTRMEVHDLANALEALVNPGDSLAVASLLRGPFVGLS
ncbi:3'-5' exonuclease, partial [Acinetobacter baumannii]